MADADLSALANLVTPIGTDIIYVVADPASTKVPSKCSIATFFTTVKTETNTTFALGSNTLTGTAAEFDTACTDDNFVYTSDGVVLTTDNLSALATSTAAQLDSHISDENVAYEGQANTWGAVNQNISATGKWQEGGVNISPIGLHDAWIPASAMWLASTLPATSFTQREIATSLVDIQAMVFTSTTADETVQCTWTIPKEWDGNTTALTVEFFWTATGGAAGNVVWGVQAVGYANDDPLTGAFGTIAKVTDAWIANDDLHISGTASVTVAGTPVAGEMIQFKFLRSGSDASDTFATAAELLGVRINYTTDSAQG